MSVIEEIALKDRHEVDMENQRITPISWPEGFPPKKGAAKFFLGVRWLGPDISFFADLRRKQKTRTDVVMKLWGGGARQEIAERIGLQLQSGLTWPTPFFIPEDSWAATCHGPKFDKIDDVTAIVAIEDFEQHYGVRVPETFWDAGESRSFGDVVDGLAKLSAVCMQ